MSEFGLIGYHAAGSLSPALFRAAYGGRWPYEIIEEEDFDKAFKRFIEGDFRAVNVTAPHKKSAADAADRRSPEVGCIGAANILVKGQDGLVEAYNSDCSAVRLLVEDLPDVTTAVVVGLGGAGRAALYACTQCGYKTSFLHHDELSDGLCADLVIYTLPVGIEGIAGLTVEDFQGEDRYESSRPGKVLLEANYKTPAFGSGDTVLKMQEGGCQYVPGRRWHLYQALTGYSLMTGEQPDFGAMLKESMNG